MKKNSTSTQREEEDPRVKRMEKKITFFLVILGILLFIWGASAWKASAGNNYLPIALIIIFLLSIVGGVVYLIIYEEKIKKTAPN